jgi:hypothetical protein
MEEFPPMIEDLTLIFIFGLFILHLLAPVRLGGSEGAAGR